MVKSRSAAALSVALVFLSGVLVGAVATRLVSVGSASSSVPGAPPRPPDRTPEEVRRRLVDEMRTEVKLDDQQVKDLEQIYDHTREQFDELHKRLDSGARAVRDKQTEAIKAILRPDQVPLFDQLRARHEAARKAHHKNDKGPDQK